MLFILIYSALKGHFEIGLLINSLGLLSLGLNLEKSKRKRRISKMVMKLNKSQLVKVSKQLDGALEALDLLFQYQEGAKLMDDSKIDFSAIVGLRNKVEEMAEKKSRKKRTMKKRALLKESALSELCIKMNWKKAVVVFTEASFTSLYTEVGKKLSNFKRCQIF